MQLILKADNIESEKKYLLILSVILKKLRNQFPAIQQISCFCISAYHA